MLARFLHGDDASWCEEEEECAVVEDGASGELEVLERSALASLALCGQCTLFPALAPACSSDDVSSLIRKQGPSGSTRSGASHPS